MAGKSKFQISKSLDEKIKRAIEGSGEIELDSTLDSAYIIGFHYNNVSSYVGVTTDYQLNNSGYPVVGLVFYKSSPSTDDIKSRVETLKEFTNSPDGLGSFKTDKNEHLFLIYTLDAETKLATKKIFDSLIGEYSQEQPKLSVLDDAKIFNHSALIKLSLNLRLDILETPSLLVSKEKIETVVESVKKTFYAGTKDVTIHLANSNFSTNSASNNKNLTETLYDYLDAPDDVIQMGDYLPQLSKSEKQKLIDKYRNKMKSQREPLELKLETETPASSPGTSYNFELDSYLHVQVNDPISKTIQVILFSIRQTVVLLNRVLLQPSVNSIEPGELKSATFKPQNVCHLIPAVYPIPSNSRPNYELLSQLRRELHQAYIVPLDRPNFRFSSRLSSLSMTNGDERAGYLCNVHSGILENSGIKGGAKNVIEGTYTYHHYLQDRVSDSGWGCAYRSLQTIISWYKHQGYICSPDVEVRALKEDKTNELRMRLNSEARVPTHEEIQSVLVDVGDKQASFVGSQKWIGSQEVCYVLSHLYDIDSKFISVSSGGELAYKVRDLGLHFAAQSTPIMIGGGVLAHTIIGVDFNEKNGDVSYLILDPHYTGQEDLSVITKKGWCGWKKNTFWDKSAFYNLCLPQRPSEF